jgi:hypothetical protein
MRRAALLLAGAALQAGAAHAAAFDSRGVARFDVGYARCEAKFAPMKGHRDEAYLAVYRVKVDAPSLARLAALRRTPEYQKERKAALAAKPPAAPASAASSPLEQQCQALWAETRRFNAPTR